MFRQAVGSLICVVVLAGCGSTKVQRDSGPPGPVRVDHVPDAVPRHEPQTRAGNKSPYKVLGKTYHLLPQSKGYRKQGTASWYGRKFHGRHTANGEIYNMYAMTAAHKTLPIPCYVRVTNQSNGRSVIVRVNDRGPFHGDRIIDLSYTAAAKLGFDKMGTAPVLVEVVEPGSSQYAAVKPTVKKVPSTRRPSINSAARSPSARSSAGVSATHSGASRPRVNVAVQDSKKGVTTHVDVSGYKLPGNTFLQVGAFGTSQAANNIQSILQPLTRFPVKISRITARGADLYRVRIGPVIDNLDLLALREMLRTKSIAHPQVVYD